MGAFDYLALDAKGRKKKGVMEGDTPRAVRQSLREQGLTPMEVTTASQKSSSGGAKRGHRGGISITALSLLTRQLGTLLKASLPLEESLKAVSEQSESPKVTSLMLAIRSRVKEGHSLAAGMQDFPRVFPDMYRSSVRAGEESGHLDNVLERLADYVEVTQDRKNKIQGAMTYPIVLLVVSVGIVGFLMYSIVPKMVAVYQNNNTELPALTKGLIAFSDFLQNNWIVLAIGIPGVVLGLIVLFRQPGPKYWLHRTSLRIPLVKHIVRGANTAQFASTLSILAGSGVPVLDALKISSEVVSNLPMRDAVNEATVKVSEGATLNKSLAATKLFPPMMVHLIASGEASGTLEEMLDRAAVAEQRALDARLGTLISLLGPIMILLMGGMVVTIVMAMLMPIFQFTAQIG